MKRTILGIVAVATCLLQADSSEAQIRVGRFGGVNVRVPFVSVDVLPFGGGTRVRAPFTSVQTGAFGYGGFGYGVGAYGYSSRYNGFGYRPYLYGGSVYRSYNRYDIVPVVPVPVVPLVPVFPDPLDDYLGYDHLGYDYLGYGRRDYVYPERFADSDRHQVDPYRSARPAFAPPSDATRAAQSPVSLEDDLRVAADRLARALSRRRDDADVWLDYLRPDLIIETIDRGQSPAALSGLLLNYEGLVGNAQLSQLWTTDGFRQTHQLLRQWVGSAGSSVSVDSVPQEGSPALAAPLDQWSGRPGSERSDQNEREYGKSLLEGDDREGGAGRSVTEPESSDGTPYVDPYADPKSSPAKAPPTEELPTPPAARASDAKPATIPL